KETGFSYLSLLKAVLCGDASAIRKVLNGLLMTSISFFDTAGENFYHGFMLGLCATLSSYYRISSNRESGNGRYDIMMHPLKELCPGVVFELKVCNRDEKLHDAALEAISQIRTKEYTRALSDQKVMSAILFGVAFHGKKAEVESEIIALS
ncbi:MAG: PD-(D/E)XK nuclease domain-containing protein, partial [Bullifex sp.]